jgi:integrase
MRLHQSGWVQLAGTRRQKWVGRYRVYKPDGSLSMPKMFLGWKSELSKSAASIKLEKFLRAGGDNLHSPMNFADYWHGEYVPRHRVSWSVPTASGYEAYFRAYLQPEFGSVHLVDIQERQINTWLERLRQAHSRSVVQKCWVILKSVLEDAVDDDILLKSPMRKVRRPKTKLPSRPTLDKELARRALAEVTDARNAAILHVGVFCAVRPAEVFGLRWRSFLNDMLLVRDSAWNGRLLEDATKTGERRIVVPPATREAILRWRDECPDTSPAALMFPNQKGKPISSHNFRNRVLVPLQQKLGIEVPLTFQVLRRSHATRNQLRLKDVQSHLGHKSIKTTGDIYVQEIPASVREMVASDEADVLGISHSRNSIAALTAARVPNRHH